MGFNFHWIGFKDLPLAEAAAALGLALSGQSEEVPDFSVSGATVGDWSIVIYDYYQHDTSFLAKPEILRQLSEKREIIVVNIDETVMFSYAEHWKSGEMQWNITHDGQKGVRDLEVDGVPPAWFEELMSAHFEKLEAENGQVDYIFGVPTEMAGRLSGFWIDRGEPEDGFFELVPVSADTGSSK